MTIPISRFARACGRLRGGARPTAWVHFLALPLASATSPLGAARGVAIALFVLAFGYLLNAVSDRAMDRPAKNPLSSGESSASATPVLLALASAAGALAAFAPSCTRIATAVSLGAGVVYSVGPRLKRVPLLGTATNVACFAPLLWTGASGDDRPPGMHSLAAAFTCLLLQNQLLHEAADRDEDRAGLVRTSVLAIGHRRAALAAAFLGLAAAACAPEASWTLAWAMTAAFAIGFPALLARFGGSTRLMSAARVAHRACSALAGAWLFALLRFGW